MWSDLKQAARQLVRAPVFTVVAVLTLALCIGANSAIFSVVHAVLYKSDPWPQAEQLVAITNSYPGLNLSAGVSVPDFVERKEQIRGLADAALYFGFNLNYAADAGEPQQVIGLRATPSLFSTLRTGAALGRTFSAQDAEPGAAPTVVLSHDVWRNLFGGDRGIVGRRVRFNGVPTTVIGVMPPGFYFPDPRIQAWTPFAFLPAQRSDQERGREFAQMIGRLRSGASVAGVREELRLLQQRNEQRLPAAAGFWRSTRFHGEAFGYREHQVQDVQGMLWLVQAAVTTALLIGCANVAGLLLARAVGREREMAVRSALGAGRGRLVRLLLTESGLLFAGGAGLGLLVAWWGLAALQRVGFTQLPRSQGIALDAPVVLFTLGCAALAALGFGALPARGATGSRAAESLKEAGTRGSTAGRRTTRLRNLLVSGEIALAVMLLATATLLVKSFASVQNQNPGFVSGGVLTAEIALPSAKYRAPGRLQTFYRTLMEGIVSTPGVTAAGLIDVLPFSKNDASASYGSPDIVLPPGTPPLHANIRQVDPGYRQALGLTLLRGRWFAPADSEKAEPVAAIDRILADRYWRGQDPLGKRLIVNGTVPAVVVGMVAPVKNDGLDENVAKETIYLPLAQAPSTYITVVVRTAGNPSLFASAVRSSLRTADPEQPVLLLRTMQERVAESLQRRRTPMMLVSAFSGVALLLACLGVYGVLSFSAAQRLPEFAVRVALGATAAAIRSLVLRQAAAIIGAGVGAGLAGYFLLSRVIGRMLFGVGALDVGTLIGVPALLAAVALVAGLLPAARASRVDPMTALRSE